MSAAKDEAIQTKKLNADIPATLKLRFNVYCANRDENIKDVTAYLIESLLEGFVIPQDLRDQLAAYSKQAKMPVSELMPFMVEYFLSEMRSDKA